MRHEKILVVDDDTRFASSLTEILTSRGYCNIENATNGLEGLEKYTAAKPDLVLMDMNMPIMNGYEACRKIKQFDPDANIIVMTGDTQGDNAQKIIREGYTSVLLKKPVSVSLLLENIKRELEHQSLKILLYANASGSVYAVEFQHKT